ncbi:hypothetical protein C0J52_24229, partial [Blattella germanica]
KAYIVLAKLLDSEKEDVAQYEIVPHICTQPKSFNCFYKRFSVPSSGMIVTHRGVLLIKINIKLLLSWEHDCYEYDDVNTSVTLHSLLHVYCGQHSDRKLVFCSERRTYEVRSSCNTSDFIFLETGDRYNHSNRNVPKNYIKIIPCLSIANI